MNNKDEITTQLKALKQKFISGLPQRLNIIQGHRRRWLDGESEEALADFHRTTHSLTGAGATFGCSEISQCARELERHIESLLEIDSPPPTTQQLTKIEHYFKALQASTEEHLGEEDRSDSTKNRSNTLSRP